MAYIRKTRDEWQVQGLYGYGWETLTLHNNRKEAKKSLKEYDMSELNYPHRVSKVRVRIESEA